MKKYDLSIVIPSLGIESNLDRILKSIDSQQTEGLIIQTIVILNGVAPDLLKYFEIKYEKNSNLKFYFIDFKNASYARNIGLKNTNSELVYFLDDDCELISNRTILNYINFSIQYPDIFAFGGGYRIPDNSGFFDRIYNHIQMNWFLDGLLDTQLNSKYLLGGNFLINKQHLTDDINFLDSIAYGGSESYFFVLAKSKGKKIRHTPLDVFHYTKETFLSVVYKTYKQGQGQAIIVDHQNRNSLLISKNIVKNDEKKMDTQGKNNFSEPLTFFILIFRYTYWFGYYSQSRSYFKFIAFVINNVVGYLNFRRHKILEKIKPD